MGGCVQFSHSVILEFLGGDAPPRSLHRLSFVSENIASFPEESFTVSEV